eukprot:2929856-Lingulodinium_polyedra.AAC.1
MGAHSGAGSRRGGRGLHSRRGLGLAQGVRPRVFAGGYRSVGASRRAFVDRRAGRLGLPGAAQAARGRCVGRR